GGYYGGGSAAGGGGGYYGGGSAEGGSTGSGGGYYGGGSAEGGSTGSSYYSSHDTSQEGRSGLVGGAGGAPARVGAPMVASPGVRGGFHGSDAQRAHVEAMRRSTAQATPVAPVSE
ncbi:unnamed protein product, partial [Polarella glacialis]